MRIVFRRDNSLAARLTLARGVMRRFLFYFLVLIIFGLALRSRLTMAYATRRRDGGGLPAARAILDEAYLRPKQPTVAYNLACYACQLGTRKGAHPLLEKPSRQPRTVSNSTLTGLGFGR